MQESEASQWVNTFLSAAPGQQSLPQALVSDVQKIDTSQENKKGIGDDAEHGCSRKDSVGQSGASHAHLRPLESNNRPVTSLDSLFDEAMISARDTTADDICARNIDSHHKSS